MILRPPLRASKAGEVILDDGRQLSSVDVSEVYLIRYFVTRCLQKSMLRQAIRKDYLTRSIQDLKGSYKTLKEALDFEFKSGFSHVFNSFSSLLSLLSLLTWALRLGRSTAWHGGRIGLGMFGPARLGRRAAQRQGVGAGSGLRQRSVVASKNGFSIYKLLNYLIILIYINIFIFIYIYSIRMYIYSISRYTWRTRK